MKLSGMLPKGCPSPLAPFPTWSGTSMSSKTPGRDLKDMKRLENMKTLEGSGESWQGSRWSILLKLLGMLPRGNPSPLTPIPTLSGTPMSSKTPGKDLEDMESLGERLSQSCYPGLAISATLSWSRYLGLAIWVLLSGSCYLGLTILVMLSWSCYLGLTISISLSKSHYLNLTISISLSQSHYPSLAIKVSLSQ